MNKNGIKVFAGISWIIFISICLAREEAPKPSIDTAPGIVFSSLDHDFGDQVSGKTLEHTFTFKNHGTVPFSIKDVKAG